VSFDSDQRRFAYVTVQKQVLQFNKYSCLLITITRLFPIYTESYRCCACWGTVLVCARFIWVTIGRKWWHFLL